MISTKDWFFSQRGEWESFRRYLYPQKDSVIICKSRLAIGVEPTDSGCSLILSWNTKGDIESKGEMLVNYLEDEGVMIRSRGYFTDNQTISKVEQISDSTIQTETVYGGKRYLEKIELHEGFRTRQTLGWATDPTGVGDGKLILVGQYFERKLC
jgi:hypothetical protein